MIHRKFTTWSRSDENKLRKSCSPSILPRTTTLCCPWVATFVEKLAPPSTSCSSPRTSPASPPFTCPTAISRASRQRPWPRPKEDGRRGEGALPGLLQGRGQVLTGKTADQVLEFAKKENIDLIIMGAPRPQGGRAGPVRQRGRQGGDRGPLPGGDHPSVEFQVYPGSSVCKETDAGKLTYRRGGS